MLLGNGGAVGPREGVAGQRTKNSLVYLCVDRKRSDVLVFIQVCVISLQGAVAKIGHVQEPDGLYSTRNSQGRQFAKPRRTLRHIYVL